MPARSLLWFNPLLILPYARTEDRLFWRNVVAGGSITNMMPRPHAMEWHLAIRRVTRMGNLLNDGTGLSRSYGDGLNLARIPSNNGQLIVDLQNGSHVDRNFASMVDHRMENMLAAADAVGANTIYLSYSGGSDSLLILAAAMNNPRAREMIKSGNMVILTNHHARREDTEAWQRLLETGAKMQIVDYDALMKNDGNWMMVTGDGECYGTMFIGVPGDYLPRETMCKEPVQCLARMFLDRDFTGMAWDYFRQLMLLAPFPVETVHQAWWWFEQCVDRQDDFMRFNAFSLRADIRKDCIGHSPRVFHFFSGQDFLDHAAYNVLGDNQPVMPDLIKRRSDEYISRWLGHTETKPRPKFYSQDRIIRCLHKQRIFDDLSWDAITDLEGFYQ